MIEQFVPEWMLPSMLKGGVLISKLAWRDWMVPYNKTPARLPELSEKSVVVKLRRSDLAE